MSKIKIKFSDTWKNFILENNAIYRILDKNYDIEMSDNPDYIICSAFGEEYKKYPNALRIFFTSENLTPDFNSFDYCIGFDDITFGDRYLRVPNLIMNHKYENIISLMREKHLVSKQKDIPEQFCGIVVSNKDAEKTREIIWNEVNKYKEVSSGGRYRNNVGQSNGVSDKLEFQKQFKFVLAMENISFPGYTTEKLAEAFAAGGVPIYWGDPDIAKYYNPRAFINVNEYESLDDVIGKIKYLDNNDEEYLKYRGEPALLDMRSIEKNEEALEVFIKNIFDQPYEKAFRRPVSWWSQRGSLSSDDKGKTGKFRFFSGKRDKD